MTSTLSWLLSRPGPIFLLPYWFFLRTLLPESLSCDSLSWVGSASVERYFRQIHCQSIKNPCVFSASGKKTGVLLHIVNLKNSHANLRFSGREFEGEEEYLEILGITREQSGKYECKAANEVSSADVKQVKVTVNCEYGKSQQVQCAQGPPPPLASSKDPISKRTLHFKQTRLWSGIHIYTLDISKGRTWPLNLINQLYQL